MGKVGKLTGTLEENLLRLQPLVHESWPRVLLTSAANDEWTAMFDGDAYGQGVGELTAYVAYRLLRVRGYFVVSAPSAGNPEQGLGGRQFRVLGPEVANGSVRSIDLIESSLGRWHFETNGEVQPFEDVGAYGRRRRVDRFTEQMLVDYAGAVGLRPWDESFYRNPSYLVTNGERVRSAFTLEQAREKLGLDN